MLIKANKRMYVQKYCAKNGAYCKVPLQRGHGIFQAIGKAGTKSVLGSLGKNVGGYGGKQLAKLIETKTGSPLLGKISKGLLNNIGSYVGQNLGSKTGKLLGNTVFSDDSKKEKKNENEKKITLNELLNQTRAKLSSIIPQSGNGLNIVY